MQGARNEIQKSILVIDDEENMRHMLSALLKKHGYLIEDVADGKLALQAVSTRHFDYILCDVRMPGMDGLQFLKLARNHISSSTIIMMSAYGSVDTALEAIKAGAYDFISKPFKTDEVLLALKKAEERELLKTENRQLKKTIKNINTKGGFRKTIGENNKIKLIIELAKKISPYDASVLITGESGTGKELIARGIHEHSKRNKKQFYAINCGSIPGELLESELFGYARGAFTGADKNKKGILEAADGSTLFLDEIGEMPFTMQVKLLRVLQECEILPVGTLVPKKINVRILAATAKKLEEEVHLGTFREDLLYRLNVFTLHLPPLRKRADDIPLLCKYFLKKYNKRFGTAVKMISKDTMRELVRYRWPGNVRELENIIQRGVVLAIGDVLSHDLLPDNFACEVTTNDIKNSDTSFSLKKAQKVLEAEMIQKALEETGGNKSKASNLLEISYPSLLNKIKEFKLFQ